MRKWDVGGTTTVTRLSASRCCAGDMSDRIHSERVPGEDATPARTL
jgi:hypothetical protein